jgi:hypothetical protein
VVDRFKLYRQKRRQIGALCCAAWFCGGHSAQQITLAFAFAIAQRRWISAWTSTTLGQLGRSAPLRVYMRVERNERV